MDLTLSKIADWTDGTLHPSSAGDVHVRDVATDSRGTLPEQSLFVALRGEHFDGHDYVEEAFDKGAAAALVSDPDCTGADANLVVADDTLDAFQNLARLWRLRFDIPVIGVTGSNGKTIVKDMISGILAQVTTVHRSPASYNSQVGVPLTLTRLGDSHQVSVVEAGISRPNEMDRLQAMIRPTAGVLTNIGLAHAAGLETLEKTAREKLKLFRDIDDAPLVHPAECAPLEPFELPGRSVSFGCAFSTDVAESVAEADYLAVHADRTDGGFRFEVAFPTGEHHEFALHVPGEHNLMNAVAAIALCAELPGSVEGAETSDSIERRVPIAAIREGLAAYETSPLRLEMHTTPRDITLINDAYSSDPVSARAALRTLQQYGSGHRNVAILGDMLDLGDRSKSAHRTLGEATARTGVDELVCFGERARAIGESAIEHGLAPDHVEYTADRDELHELLDRILEPGDVVLFKASRSLELERAAERLLESVAPTRLRIDLDAIRDNYHALRRQLDEDAGFMAVVKSFGYGNDSTRVSQTLAQEGVDALAVAYPDEGIPLRDRGLHLPILVMNVVPGEADKIVTYDLAALVYSRPVVEALQREAAERDETVSVHLNVDTGMHRVGLAPDDAVEFAQFVQRQPAVEIAGIMTHFAAADLPEEDDFTSDQLAAFREVLADLDDAGVDPGVVHAANTAAAWRFPESHFDMIRVGLGLYGLAPSDSVYRAARNARPALEFTTRIIHIKELDAGETVGYGRTYRADRPRTIATIAAGYNDGLPRFMSRGGEVLIDGVRCPIVGDVCMDVSMVDVSELDDPAVGDEVVLFGAVGEDAAPPEITVDEIAERGDTINYEILCNISPRVRRIFVRR